MTMPTTCLEAPAACSLASSRGSTVSEELVPTMISSSSRISRIRRKIEKPAARATAPSTTITKNAQVPQKTAISAPRLVSESAPKTATV